MTFLMSKTGACVRGGSKVGKLAKQRTIAEKSAMVLCL